MTCHNTKGKKRKIQVTGAIDSGEPCSKNIKVSVSNVQSTSNSTVSNNKHKNTDLHKSRCPKKSKCDDNSLRVQSQCQSLDLKYCTLMDLSVCYLFLIISFTYDYPSHFNRSSSKMLSRLQKSNLQ